MHRLFLGTWIYPIWTVWLKFSVNCTRKFLPGWFFEVLSCSTLTFWDQTSCLFTEPALNIIFLIGSSSELKRTVILVCCLHILWDLVAAKCLSGSRMWQRWVGSGGRTGRTAETRGVWRFGATGCYEVVLELSTKENRLKRSFLLWLCCDGILNQEYWNWKRESVC